MKKKPAKKTEIIDADNFETLARQYGMPVKVFESLNDFELGVFLDSSFTPKDRKFHVVKRGRGHFVEGTPEGQPRGVYCQLGVAYRSAAKQSDSRKPFTVMALSESQAVRICDILNENPWPIFFENRDEHNDKD